MIKLKTFGVITLLLMVGGGLSAQAPEITSIDAPTNYPTKTITIIGTGFNNTPSNLGVSFGGVLANIISSSTTTIEVEVPVNGQFENIEVINYATGLSVKSKIKFYSTFGGSTFDISDIDDPIEFAAFNEQHDLCICDLDGDGKRDITTSRTKDQTDLIVYHNQTAAIGSIAFNPLDKSDIANLNVTVPTRNITCGDLNGDGKPELIIVRNDNTKNAFYILENTSTAGTLSFSPKIEIPVVHTNNVIRVLVRDINFDGKPELVVSNTQDAGASEDNRIAIFINQSSLGGSPVFNSSPQLITVTGTINSGGIEVQDLDNDGKPEIITTPEGGNNVYILKNNSGAGSISFASAIEITTDQTIRNLKTGYINDDDLVDIVVTHTADNSISIIKNTSTSGNITTDLIGTWGTDTEPWGIDMADLEGDGDLDLIVSNNGLNTLNIFINESDASTFQFAPNIVKTVSNRTRNVAVADFDNDAKPDIAFTSAEANASAKFVMGVMRNSNCYNPNILSESTLYLCDQPLLLETVPGIEVTYDWYLDNAFIQGPSHGSNTANESFYVANVSGVYKVQATSDGGACSVWSQNITILDESGNVPPTPTAVNLSGPRCPGDNIVLDVTFTVPVDPTWTYEWTGPNGFSSTVKSPTITNVTADNEGIYTITVKAGNCVSAESAIFADVLTLQEFTVTAIGATEFCSGASSTLSINNRSGHSYQWQKDGNPISGAISTSYVANAAGSYNVKVTNISTTCTVETNAVIISIFTPPTASFNVNDVGCLNENVSFTNTSILDASASAVYLWDFGDGNTSTAANPVHSYNTLNTYTVELIVNYDGLSCANATTQSVEIVPSSELIITSSAQALCQGEEVVMEVDDAQFANILWSTSETTASITVADVGDYSVTAVDSNGCNVTSMLSIIEKPIPEIFISLVDNKNEIIKGEQIQLTASGADTYAWSPSETLNDTTIANPIATPEVTTVYTVVGTVTDGCSGQNSVEIVVREISDAPKIFNANNADGELWSIKNEDATTCNLSIFDRNGSKVFEASGTAVEWDGTSGGSKLPGGTYFYVYGCDQDKPRTGSILLVDL